MIDKDELYNRLDEDESLTDEERREIYFAEIENERIEQEWEENNR